MKNNREQVLQFICRMEKKKRIADGVDCLMIVDFYDNEFGLLNVRWDPELQLIYMYDRLREKYSTNNDER